MARAAHQLLQINFVLAKSRTGFTLRRNDAIDKFTLSLDRAHAAAAAAPRGFEHDGVTDLGGSRLDRVCVAGQRIARGHHRHADTDGEIACINFVAEGTQRLGAWADENQVTGMTGLGELGALREETITRVYRIDLRLFCDSENSEIDR